MEGIEMTDEALTELNRKIAVMRAYRDGREVEFFNYGSEQWYKRCLPGWDWTEFDYRVKPFEPRRIRIHPGITLFESEGEFIELTPEVCAKLNL